MPHNDLFERSELQSSFFLFYSLPYILFISYTCFVSAKRVELPGSPLCRRTFADGRRCALPAHPDHNGLCLPHGSRHKRTTPRKELNRSLANLVREDRSASEIFHVLDNAQRSLGTPSRGDRFSTLTYLSKIILESERFAQEVSFRKGSGRSVEQIRKLLDDLAPHSSPNS